MIHRDTIAALGDMALAVSSLRVVGAHDRYNLIEVFTGVDDFANFFRRATGIHI